MLQNAYFLAKIGTNTAENERNFAEMLPKIGNYPTGPAAPSRASRAAAAVLGEEEVGEEDGDPAASPRFPRSLL